MSGRRLTARRRLALFGSLYFAQGVILSYFLTFNLLYLRRHGLDADEIGLFQAVLVVPFVLKILLGLLSDRYSLFGLGHRFPYIVLGLLVQLLAILMLPGVELPGGLDHLFLLALTAAVGMAMYDTCTDGFAVESTPADERSLVQGAMVGARAAGILCTLLLGAWLVDRSDWSMLFGAMAVLTLPALVLTLAFWQPRQSAPTPSFRWSAFGSLRQRNVLLLASMGVIYTLALDALLAYLSYHPDAGSVADIATVSTLVAISMAGRILGALISGRLSEHLGYRRSIALAAALSVVACVALAAVSGTPLLAAACLLFGFAYGYYTAVYAAAAMLLSDPRIAASMFAIFMMFLNLGVAAGQAVGGVITQALGFHGLALVMAVLGLINLLLVRGIRD